MSCTIVLCLLAIAVISGEVVSAQRENSGPYEILIDHFEECKDQGENKLNLTYNLEEVEPNLKTWSTNWTWPYDVDDSILPWGVIQMIKDGEQVGSAFALPFGDLCYSAFEDFPELIGELFERMGLPTRCPIPAGTYELRDWPLIPFSFSLFREIPYGNYSAEIGFARENTTTDTVEYFGCFRFIFEAYPSSSS